MCKRCVWCGNWIFWRPVKVKMFDSDIMKKPVFYYFHKKCHKKYMEEDDDTPTFNYDFEGDENPFYYMPDLGDKD